MKIFGVPAKPDATDKSLVNSSKKMKRIAEIVCPPPQER